MSYSSGAYSTSAHSALAGTTTSAFPAGTVFAETTDQIVLGFTTDGAISATGDTVDATIVVGFVCDAELIAGTGGPGFVTKPTLWDEETEVSSTWVEDDEIKGV